MPSRQPGRLLKVLCTFSLRPVSTGMAIVRSKKLCIENLQSGLLLQTEAELRVIIGVSFRLFR